MKRLGPALNWLSGKGFLIESKLRPGARQAKHSIQREQKWGSDWRVAVLSGLEFWSGRCEASAVT